MKKTITYSSFAIAMLLVVAAFFTARTYTQLGVAVLLYPLIVYFAYQLFIKRQGATVTIQTSAMPESVKRHSKSPSRKIREQESEAKTEVVGVVDIDKRAFLKLIGATGISFFLFSIFGRRVDSFLFNRESGDGNFFGASQTSSLDGYKITEIDDSAVSFYGFVNNQGGWFIMKEDTDGSFRYSKGEANFQGNWDNRKNLRYDYFHNIF